MAKVLSPEEGEQYQRLYAAYRDAVNRGAEILVKNGMDSSEFQAIDKEQSRLLDEMRKLRGEPRGHWMG